MAAHLLLSGYFGEGNLGDDSILLGFMQGLSRANYRLTVLSGGPEETFRNFGVDAVNRKKFRDIDKAIAQCDALVFPGGSIFQDVTSVKSVAYYHQVVRKAKQAGKKVILVGQGVGPLNHFLGRKLAMAAFNSADAVAVRDQGSAQALKALGYGKKIWLTADPAFLLTAPPSDEANTFQVGDMRTVGLAPRPHGKGRDVVNLFGDLARMVFQANMMPVLIEMDRAEDAPLILEISKQQGGKIPDLRKMATPTQLLQRMARMDSVIAMRLHAGILATTVGIPPLMVSYDPKVTAFAKQLEMGAALPFEGLTAHRLFERYMEFVKDRERNAKILERKREELTKLAYQNIELIDEVMRQTAKA